jgi:hypothetical protein
MRRWKRDWAARNRAAQAAWYERHWGYVQRRSRRWAKENAEKVKRNRTQYYRRRRRAVRELQLLALTQIL